LDIDLAVIAFAMSGVNGAELARLAQSRRTALPIVFVTGYVDMHRYASLGEIGEERMSRSIRERQACEYSTRPLRMPAVDIQTKIVQLKR
jgi:DNA-binding LytR/AlgR family response regulator